MKTQGQLPSQPGWRQTTTSNFLTKGTCLFLRIRAIETPPNQCTKEPSRILFITVFREAVLYDNLKFISYLPLSVTTDRSGGSSSAVASGAARCTHWTGGPRLPSPTRHTFLTGGTGHTSEIMTTVMNCNNAKSPSNNSSVLTKDDDYLNFSGRRYTFRLVKTQKSQIPYLKNALPENS